MSYIIKCNHCQKDTTHVSDSFYCQSCAVRYCLNCTSAYFMVNSKFVLFSDKLTDHNSPEFGFNYRRPESEMYCERCVEYVLKFNERQKLDMFDKEFALVQANIQIKINRLSNKYTSLVELYRNYIDSQK